MAGIITARFGLWVSDLTITQVLQENVLEEHRGIIGGVQTGMNSAMNTIKFILVIVLPQQETFGWLILASFTFVSFGAISYIYYATKEHNNPKNQTSITLDPQNHIEKCPLNTPEKTMGNGDSK